MARSILALTCALMTSFSEAGANEITGKAILPADAAAPASGTFIATLLDTSLADVPAKVLGRYEASLADGPPYAFAIQFDESDVRAGHSFSVSADLRSADGRLLFISNTSNPVISNDVMSVEVFMISVQGESDKPKGRLTAVGLRLPATFTGLLPCADCEGIEYALNLWPNGGFHMSRTWRGSKGELSQVDLGTWHADPEREAIVLFAGDDEREQFEVIAPDRLRLLDRMGNKIESDLSYDLASEGRIRDLDISDVLVGGLMTYREGVPFFEECFSGRVYPIARGGGFEALKSTWDENGVDRLYVQFQGAIAMNPEYADRFGRSISVDRFVRARPELTCERQRTTAALFNTYWKIDELRGDPLVTPDAGREPHIVLLRGELGRFRATVGCNQLIGSVTASREALSFGRQGAATLKACPQPFDALERELAGVLSETRNYRGTGETLLLLDGDGSIVSILTAVYFR